MLKFLLIIGFIGNATITSLSPYDFYNRLNSNVAVLLLDVRILEDYEAGHIERAQWAGNKIVLDSVVANYNKKEVVFVYCDYGQRTKSVIKLLKKCGFQKIIELEGGLELWKAQGFPLCAD